MPLIPDSSKSTYYVYPIRFEPSKANTTRNNFVRALNAEGAEFFQGYVEPLYLQPLYQSQKLFRHSYPFAAPENIGHTARYEKGTCPIAEILHYEKMLINEHIRYPHTLEDMKQLVRIIDKVTG